ncbi:alanyl-tRNA editing protein, partial [Candidatus Bathyarchaeota archaeon]
MTRKLYWDEPYSRKFTATVEELDGNNVVLDRTLFYP